MWKLLALLAGAAGVAGFFLPLAEYTDASGHVIRTASAYEIATSTADAAGLADLARGFGASPERAAEIEEAANASLLASRGAVVACFVPAALLALVALVNAIRGRMGRFAGLLVAVLGAANGAVVAYFYVGAQRTDTALGPGAWSLAGAGAGALLAGLATLLAPDDD